MGLDHLKIVRKKPAPAPEPEKPKEKVQPKLDTRIPPQGGSSTAQPKPKQIDKGHKGKGKPKPMWDARCRLPAGSEKILKWNGQMWYGTLQIPGVEDLFWFEAGSEMSCCHGLHRMYEQWQKEQEKPVADEVKKE